MASVWVSIGSNIDREKNVGFAISTLKQRFPAIRFSPVYQTQAIGFVGDDFYNLLGQFDTDLAIVKLHHLFNDLERQSGRADSYQPFEDRTLDIDLLLYDDLVYKTNQITLPHPDVLTYDFVLMPLSQEMPDFVHPETGRSLAAHWASTVPSHPFHELNLQAEDFTKK